jgi:NitT/TauT family transport system substrate-binding protein
VKSRKTLVGAVVAAAAALVLTACSGGAGAKISTNSSGLLPLKIGYTALGAGYADLYDAKDYGIFAKHGLDVQLVRLNDSSQLVAGLASNSVQIGVGVASDSAAAIMKGAKLKFVAMSEPHYNLEMWAAPSVATINDLKGKKVAITSPGSESDYGLTDLLKSKGMARTDITTEYVKGVPAEVSALESGAVSAILTQPPNGTQSREKGAHRLAELSGLPFALGTYTVEGTFADNNKDVVSKFVAAEQDALTYLHNPANEKNTETAIKKYSGVESDDLAKYAYQFFLNVWASKPAVDPDLIKAAFTEAAANSKTTPPTDVSQYIDNVATS